MANAALLLIHGAVSFPFRTPEATYERLVTTLAGQEALAPSVSGSSVAEQVANAIGCSVDDLRQHGFSERLLASFQLTPSGASEDALLDLLEGPLSLARLCLVQWAVRAWPKDIDIAQAAGQERFQIGDFGLMSASTMNGTRHRTRKSGTTS